MWYCFASSRLRSFSIKAGPECQRVRFGNVEKWGTAGGERKARSLALLRRHASPSLVDPPPARPAAIRADATKPCRADLDDSLVSDAIASAPSPSCDAPPSQSRDALPPPYPPIFSHQRSSLRRRRTHRVRPFRGRRRRHESFAAACAWWRSQSAFPRRLRNSRLEIVNRGPRAAGDRD